MNNKQAIRAAIDAWILAGRPRASGPVEVQITLHRGRMMDQDNALAACKGIIDGLFKVAITEDDTPLWVRFRPVEQITGSQYRRAPWVLVEVFSR